jgi:predicted phosphodiesterase
LETDASSVRRQNPSESETRPKMARRTKYRHIIHCGSVRQEVEIDSMQEIPLDLRKERFEVNGVNLSAASAAAAVLCSGNADEEAGIDAPDDELIGAVVDVTFTFRKPEWLIPGLRFVLRDQNGGVSAAGVIRSVPV